MSPKAGKCEAIDCPMNGEPLEQCDCEDSSHYGAFKEEAENDNDNDGD